MINESLTLEQLRPQSQWQRCPSTLTARWSPGTTELTQDFYLIHSHPPSFWEMKCVNSKLRKCTKGKPWLHLNPTTAPQAPWLAVAQSKVSPGPWWGAGLLHFSPWGSPGMGPLLPSIQPPSRTEITWPGSRGGSPSAPGDPRLLLAPASSGSKSGCHSEKLVMASHPLQSLAQRPFRNSRTRDTVSLQGASGPMDQRPPHRHPPCCNSTEKLSRAGGSRDLRCSQTEQWDCRRPSREKPRATCRFAHASPKEPVRVDAAPQQFPPFPDYHWK